MIIESLSPEAGGVLLLATPALLLGLIILSFTGGMLRSGWGEAFLAFVIGLGVIAALCAGAVFALYQFWLPDAVASCKALERAALERGDAVLLDCESESLVLAFPVLIALLSVGVFFIGAILVRLTRRRA
ncbi:MAG: hypothetical protein AAFW68_11255 [Pseudomonadota bacterium]